MNSLFSNADPPPKRAQQPINDTTANSIYQLYPKHVGKKAAIKSIKAACRDLLKEGTEDPVQSLLDATRDYRAAVMTWPESDKRFVPHPSTWFNQGHYEDDRDEWYVGERKRPSPTGKILTKWEDTLKTHINAVQNANTVQTIRDSKRNLRSLVKSIPPRLLNEMTITAIVCHAESLLIEG